MQTISHKSLQGIGPLHDPGTWYDIAPAGEQVSQYDFQNNATRTSPTGPAFVLEVPLRNLLTSMSDFVPCDRIMQRAYLRKDSVLLALTPRTDLPAFINRAPRLEQTEMSTSSRRMNLLKRLVYLPWHSTWI